MGIGEVPDAILSELKDRRDLGIHTEMFSDGVVELFEAGVINGEAKTLHRGKIVASFVLGTRRSFDFLHNNPFVEFHPTDYVNDPFVIAGNDRMVAINAALAVDLTGQVCADSIGRSIYSGFGGQADFIRGAARARRRQADHRAALDGEGRNAVAHRGRAARGRGRRDDARGRPLRRDRARHRGAARQEPARAGPGAHRRWHTRTSGRTCSARRGTAESSDHGRAERTGPIVPETRLLPGANRISTLGAIVTTASAVTMIGFWIVESLQAHPVHPYNGIVLFLILPFVFVLGLLLIPLGVLLQRRKLRARGELPQEYPKIDLQQPEWRHGLALVGLATVANVGILGAASYKGVEHMDSTQFCGVDLPQRDGPRVHGLYRLPARARRPACSATSGPAPAGSSSRSCRASARCSRSPSTPTRARSTRP